MQPHAPARSLTDLPLHQFGGARHLWLVTTLGFVVSACTAPSILPHDEMPVEYAVFDDPDSSFSTIDVYDANGDLVRIDSVKDQLVWMADLHAFEGFDVSGNAIANGTYLIRFGTIDGMKRAFLGKPDAKVLCDISVDDGLLSIVVTDVVVPEEPDDMPMGNQPECVSDQDCDDGNDCNGMETCASDGKCQDSDRTTCDDGIFCNGEEVCDAGLCTVLSFPCEEFELTCVESTRSCDGPMFDSFFTQSTDLLIGSNSIDLFSASLAFDQVTGNQVSTFQTGDTAIGHAGVDRLIIVLVGGTVITPLLSGIEQIIITDFGESASIITFSDSTDVELIASKGGLQTVTVADLPTAVNMQVEDTAYGISASFLPAATQGEDDDLTLTLIDCLDGPDSVVTINTAPNGFEIIRIESMGERPNVLGALVQTNGETLSRLVISGNQNLRIGAIPDTVTDIDISAMTGEFRIGDE